MDTDSLLTKITSIFLLHHNFVLTLSAFIMTQSQQDIQDDTRHMNSSPETIGGLAFKQTFVDTSMDARRAKELEFIETNPIILFTLTRFHLTLGNTSQSISLDPSLNQMDTTLYSSSSTKIGRAHV